MNFPTADCSLSKKSSITSLTSNYSSISCTWGHIVGGTHGDYALKSDHDNAEIATTVTIVGITVIRHAADIEAGSCCSSLVI